MPIHQDFLLNIVVTLASDPDGSPFVFRGQGENRRPELLGRFGYLGRSPHVSLTHQLVFDASPDALASTRSAPWKARYHRTIWSVGPLVWAVQDGDVLCAARDLHGELGIMLTRGGRLLLAVGGAPAIAHVVGLDLLRAGEVSSLSDSFGGERPRLFVDTQAGAQSLEVGQALERDGYELRLSTYCWNKRAALRGPVLSVTSLDDVRRDLVAAICWGLPQAHGLWPD